MDTEYFDVAVIGGGHAACEAALAAARMGAKTIMVTINLDHIAQMSCNPCIGGIAKGQVVREIDALGGAMGRVADASAIQFRMLNLTKGPAVWSPRAQCDKVIYQKAMKHELEKESSLTVRNAMVNSFLLEDGHVSGIRTFPGGDIHARSVVVATGTFLAGKLHYGLNNMPGGRAGDPPSVELAAALREQLNLNTGRLKTGTPPRILGKSIDWSSMGYQRSDPSEERFSFYPDDSVSPVSVQKDLPCRTVYTTKATADVVRANLDKAPMYCGVIKGIGTRYCPSFEDKVVRFASHERHLLYIEPEGENTDEYYLNGLSTSLPPEIQMQLLRSVPGLEKVEVVRFAYAIEYDFVHPSELSRSLGIKKWPGLFLAGQINGTSGYEEAAGQGLIAGLNAARFAAGKEPVEFGRDEAYLGVLADDIVTKEIVEPYRLFTSRAEHRISLRQDNADFRLSEKAHQWGLLPEKKYRQFREYADLCQTAEAKAKEFRLPHGRTLWDTIRDFHGIPPQELPFDPAVLGVDPEDRTGRRVLRHLAVEAHYEGYLRREVAAIGKLHALEEWQIPEDFDYSTIPGLRNEARQKLMNTRPTTLAQAGRIDGVTVYEVALLQVHLARYRKAHEAEKE